MDDLAAGRVSWGKQGKQRLASVPAPPPGALAPSDFERRREFLRMLPWARTEWVRSRKTQVKGSRVAQALAAQEHL